MKVSFMPCPNFFSRALPSNPLNQKIRLQGEELKAYNFLNTLVKNSQSNGVQSVLAPFNAPDITNKTYLDKKRFMRAVSEALFIYLNDHGALFNFSESRKFAKDNANVGSCEQALRIITAILEGSDPTNVALSSRLYKLVSQFAVDVYANADIKLYTLLDEILLNPHSMPAQDEHTAKSPKF
jgi:hypothetical protein